MRVLPYLAMGMAAACALAAYLLPEGLYLPVMGMCLSVSLIGALISRGAKPLRKLSLFFLGYTLGLLRFGICCDRTLAPAADWDGRIETVIIRISDYGYDTGYGTGAEGTAVLDGKTYALRLYLDSRESLEPGMTVTGPFRFRYTAPGGTGKETYYGGQGILLLACQEDEVEITPGEPSFRDIPARLRRRIRLALEENLPEDGKGFGLALLLGDTTGLDYATDTALKISGIRHIAAVSGLHIAILFSLVELVALRKRYLTALLGFPVLALFAAAAGFSPSVNRACLMCALRMLSRVVNREYDGPTALAFAVLVMLLGNPLTITSVSFQMSAASVAGIFLFAGRIRRWILGAVPRQNRLVRAGASCVSVTVGANLLTVPLSAYHFGTVSLIGVVTNLLCMWVVSFLFCGLVALCLLDGISGAAAAMLGKLLAWPVRYILAVSRLLSQVPMAAVYTCSAYICGWLVFVYVLLLVFLRMENKRPGRLISAAGLGLCLALVLSWAEPLGDGTRFTVLDVGQGQCLLFQTGGKTYMVDCGGDSDRETADIAAEMLLSQGISRLDGLILTHPDGDHAGAAENLLSRIDTDLLILPPEPSALSKGAGGAVVYADRELVLETEGASIRIYPPTFAGNRNENSLCLLLVAENCVILITGDRSGTGERALLRTAQIPDVDILVAGHHGAAGSTCEQLLRVCRPETVCISVSPDNPYGHPAPQLLQRLQEFGCTVFRTDRHGTIILRR